MLIALFAALGLFIGSFVNVLVLRTKSDKNWVSGRSECPHCHHKLGVVDLIPVLSYILLRGKCRYCKKPISAQYPIVELLCSVLFGLVAWHFAPSNIQSWIETIIWCVLTILLLAAAVYDWRWYELPDSFTLSSIALAAIWLVISSFVFHETSFTNHIVGAASGGVIFWGLWYFSKGKFLGSGDIRLGILMGLLLVPFTLIVAYFFAFNLAAVYAVILLVRRRKHLNDKIALGPFLIVGLYIELFFGSTILSWYGALTGLYL